VIPASRVSSKGEQQLAAVGVFCGSGVPAKVRSVLSKMAFAASLVWTTKVTKVTPSASCGGSFFLRKQELVPSL
jgi:hypothetical protein